MTFSLRLLTLALAACVYPVCLHAQECPAKADFGDKPRQYTGSYRNGAFDFATRIPAGNTGLDADDPQYQRGFTVLLPNGGGKLAVWGEVNSSEFTPRTAARFYLGLLRDQSARVVSSRYTAETLQGRSAVRLTAQFVCPHDRTRYGYHFVTALSPHGRFVYSLEWQGPISEAQEADKVLQKLTASWEFLPDR